jgi:hypothetical protein
MGVLTLLTRPREDLACTLQEANNSLVMVYQPLIAFSAQVQRKCSPR